MSLEWILYLMGVLKKINSLNSFVSVSLLVIIIVLTSIWTLLKIDDYDNDIKKRNYIKYMIFRLIAFTLTLLFVNSFIPSERTAFLILAYQQGSRLNDERMNNPTYQKFMNVINNKMDEYLIERVKT